MLTNGNAAASNMDNDLGLSAINLEKSVAT